MIRELRPESRLLTGGSPPVREIVSFSLPIPRANAGWSPYPPRGPAPPPPRGFRLVERRLAATYTLVRYRAPRPTAVPEPDAEALRLRVRRGPYLVLLPPG